MKLMVTVNPNPFTSSLVVYMQSDFAMNTVLRLMNQAGTVIRVAACTANKDENSIILNNLHRYATGHYLLEVKLLNGDLLKTISLVKI